MSNLFHLSVKGDHDSKEYAKVMKKVTKRKSAPTVKGALKGYAPGVTADEAKGIISGWRADLGGNDIILQGDVADLLRFTAKSLYVAKALGDSRQTRLTLVSHSDSSATEQSAWVQPIAQVASIPEPKEGIVAVQAYGTVESIAAATESLKILGMVTPAPDGTVLVVNGSLNGKTLTDYVKAVTSTPGLSRCLFTVNSPEGCFTVIRQDGESDELSISLSARHR